MKGNTEVGMLRMGASGRDYHGRGWGKYHRELGQTEEFIKKWGRGKSHQGWGHVDEDIKKVDRVRRLSR